MVKNQRKYFKSAKNLFEQERLEEYVSEVTLNEAKAHIALEQYEDAKTLLERTTIIAKKYDQQRLLSSAFIQSGKVSCALGSHDLAYTQVNEGLKIAEGNNLIDNVNVAYSTLSEIYNNDGDYKNSLLYLKQHIKLSDSLLHIKRENLSAGLSGQYINAYKNAENAQLKAQIEREMKMCSYSDSTFLLFIFFKISVTSVVILMLCMFRSMADRTDQSD